MEGNCDTCHTEDEMTAQHITSPFATPERSADVLGVSKTRATKLIRWARSSASRSQGISTVDTSRKSDNEKNVSKKSVK